jgi:glycosyltransferase involved in cell wall biosynthesis
VGRYPRGQLRFYPRRAVLQTVSEPIRAAILREVPAAEARVRVIPYPLAPAYLVPRVAAAPVILYAGRIHPEKGVHLLVEAFARLRTDGLRGWSLRIVGPWETHQGGGGRAYRDTLAAAAGEAVEFVEPIFDDARLVAHYQQAAIFAYPSVAERGETFGLAILEAMAAGAAPVVSALDCFRDFVRPDQNGVVFDHRSPDPVAALARALAELAAGADRRERLRAAAWATARDYALPVVAARLARDFLQLTENSSGKPCPTQPACKRLPT